MKQIASFSVDHDKICPGIYISRIDGDITSFDLRTRTPNAGDYMTNLAMHSVEHLFATAVRNGPYGENVLYFGPMGCQTGFYLITRDLAPETVRDELFRVLEEIINWSDEMPGNREIECGNYRNLDLAVAKEECAKYLAVLKEREIDFQYEV